MTWVVASLLSAVFLGVYQLCTKQAVRDNAVLPVLFFSCLCSAVVWLGLMAARSGLPEMMHVAPLGWREHLQLLLKSVIVAGSWACSYFAVKHLPVSIAAPIRATGPAWTLTGALLVLGERPSWLELAGIATTLVSFWGLSFAGAKEGIHFHRDKWIGWLMAGTLLGAVSGLYDKYLLGTAGFDAATVQCWFSIYLAVVFLPLAIGWQRRWWPRKEFHWRWSILGVSFGLLVADFLYFDALRDPEALVSIVSSLRRGSTLVAFAGGIWLFRETNVRAKLPAVLGVVIGIVLTVSG
ncbi:DMT family transporter [Opitutales bacterium ASA1]|uniref:EamA family transporter n=1 Tax=Congregicoccus parvus TaxID=3081749 RepID=UPI002B28AF3A|nr:DMT family transporter [Opitutales bacterium ASA1]